MVTVADRKIQNKPQLAELTPIARIIGEWSDTGFLQQHALSPEDRKSAAAINRELGHSSNTPDGLALVLAENLFRENAADAFLADERALRALAQRHKLPVIGSLSTLDMAVKRGLCDQATAHQAIQLAIAAGQHFSLNPIQQVFPEFKA